jgi:tRNA pseudouridine55 synthase
MNGILVINKPTNCTSRDVVNIISKKFNTKKVGHTGTLDPIASGVLVICIGNATKIVDLITSLDKEYIATFKLGIETDTLDITGTIINKKDIIIDKKDLIEVINSFKGISNQEVPKYSAIKVNGKRLYEYARNNIDIELPSRDVVIKEIELLEYNEEVKIKCRVSKGTYIRSLIRDIGYKLNTYATMMSLIRTKQGDFNIEDSFTLEDVDNDNYKLLDIKDVLNYPKVVVDKELELKIKNGQVLDKFFDSDVAIILDSNNNLIAIYKVYEKDNTLVKPYKMFK